MKGDKHKADDGRFDELVETNGEPREHARYLVAYFESLPADERTARQHAVDATIADMGASR